MPLIFSMDGSYDDFLALLYVARHPLFDLRAIAVEATGFGTPHGAPTNVAAVMALLGRPEVPIAFGHFPSLSPAAHFPLEWRIGMDRFFESMYMNGTFGDTAVLQMTSSAISGVLAPKLISQTLMESDCPVVVLTTGPVTNLAVALQESPAAARNIKAVFMMGTAYGVPNTNNVNDEQLTYNGVWGACAEDGGSTYTGLSAPLVVDGQRQEGVRRGCRGVNMTQHGETEWNIFQDVLAWHSTMGALKRSDAKVYVLAANASQNMAMNHSQVHDLTSDLADLRLRSFVRHLTKAFIQLVDEARWWDAQVAVMMSEVLTGFDSSGEGVCAGWARQRRTSVSLVWRSVLEVGQSNPYGSVVDDPNANAPEIDYCLFGNPSRMMEVFFSAVNRSRFLSGTSPSTNFTCSC
jgi:pyrimidine-specific ribonucleoside hydrolase